MTLIAQAGIDLQNHLLLHTDFPFTSETKETPPGPLGPLPSCLEPAGHS